MLATVYLQAVPDVSATGVYDVLAVLFDWVTATSLRSVDAQLSVLEVYDKCLQVRQMSTGEIFDYSFSLFLLVFIVIVVIIIIIIIIVILIKSIQAFKIIQNHSKAFKHTYTYATPLTHPHSPNTHLHHHPSLTHIHPEQPNCI